jgi:hydroxyacylglutathione hydrolase
MIAITPIRALKDNYIWMISDPTSDQVWVVDPGEAQPVIETLEKNHFILCGIILTHHHRDHSGGIPELLDYAGKIPVVGSHISSASTVTNPVRNGDEVICHSLRLYAMEIPGHTLDHTAYYGSHVLFSGDTLFSGGCGRIFEGTTSEMFISLQKLNNLPDDTRVYCGHEYTLANLKFAQFVEPSNSFIAKKIEKAIRLFDSQGCTLPSYMGEEKLTNPFLRCKQPEVIRSVENFAGRKLNDVVEVFHHLREWKNDFA